MASTSEEISETCQASISEDTSERWQATRSTVLERNQHMFNNPVMSDIKFAFPNKQTIPAHKYVLAISSPVFFAMFYGDLAEKRETVDITDCDPEVFLQFLRYLYYDDTNFGDVDRAIQVRYLADKYDVPSHKEECVDFVDRIMEPLEALDVIQHAFLLKIWKRRPGRSSITMPKKLSLTIRFSSSNMSSCFLFSKGRRCVLSK